MKLAYIATEDPRINIERIAERVARGGHGVPARDVVRRYYRSLENLGNFFDKTDDKIIIDNSVDFIKSDRDQPGRLQLETDANGDTVFLADEANLANWLIESLGKKRISKALQNYILNPCR